MIRRARHVLQTRAATSLASPPTVRVRQRSGMGGNCCVHVKASASLSADCACAARQQQTCACAGSPQPQPSSQQLTVVCIRFLASTLPAKRLAGNVAQACFKVCVMTTLRPCWSRRDPRLSCDAAPLPLETPRDVSVSAPQRRGSTRRRRSPSRRRHRASRSPTTSCSTGHVSGALAL